MYMNYGCMSKEFWVTYTVYVYIRYTTRDSPYTNSVDCFVGSAQLESVWPFFNKLLPNKCGIRLGHVMLTLRTVKLKANARHKYQGGAPLQITDIGMIAATADAMHKAHIEIPESLGLQQFMQLLTPDTGERFLAMAMHHYELHGKRSLLALHFYLRSLSLTYNFVCLHFANNCLVKCEERML
jgi:hypothetical protein